VTGVIKTFNLFYYRKSASVVRVVFRVGNRTSFICELGRGELGRLRLIILLNLPRLYGV